MAEFDEVWALERRMWLEGRSFYKTVLADDAVYAFPPPMGIFKGNAFVDQMGETGPCSDVAMGEQHALALGEHAVLVYRGEGTGHDGSTRVANCVSAYRRTDDGWQLCAHQQTPLDG